MHQLDLEVEPKGESLLVLESNTMEIVTISIKTPLLSSLCANSSV